MNTRSSTADRILEAARELFNSKGYVATSLTEIAASIGISQGNLTYHFPSKSDLAARIQSNARDLLAGRREAKQPGNIADDYVEHLLFSMTLAWNYRFLLRDRIHFADQLPVKNTELEADHSELRELLERIEAEGMFRKDAVGDLDVLARAIWVVSRYWIDYLRDFEELSKISWTDQERGISHHFAILLPCLTAAARKEFRDALEQARNRKTRSDAFSSSAPAA